MQQSFCIYYQYLKSIHDYDIINDIIGVLELDKLLPKFFKHPFQYILYGFSRVFKEEKSTMHLYFCSKMKQVFLNNIHVLSEDNWFCIISDIVEILNLSQP